MLRLPSNAALAALAILALVFLSVPYFAGPYGVKLAARLLIMASFVVSLDFMLGLGGLVSFGHAAFFGLGAYAVFFVSPESDSANLLVAMGAGAGLAAAAALIIGAFACLTRGFYFIMVTLAAGQMLFSLFHDTDIAKGSDGAYINVKPALTIGGVTLIDFDHRATFYYACFALLAITLVALYALARSPFGRAVQGLKHNETRLAALGFHTYQIKLAAFVISGAFAGLAGAMFACIDGFVTPELFSWHLSGLAIMMAVLGGAGTLVGAIFGAFGYISLEEVLKTTSLVGAFVSDHWRLGTGATLVIAVLMSPGGIAGLFGKRPARPYGEDIHHDQTPPKEQRKARAIASRDLCKFYGGLKAVNGVTLEFAPDRIHAIIGPNGAGKTTYISLLSGSTPPTSGEILIDGKNIAGWPAYKIARAGVGRSYQRTNIFLPFSVAENCFLAAQASNPSVFRLSDKRWRASERAKVAHALAAAGLSDRAEIKASELSNGEQRQLEIAMLIAGGGGVLILDEPLAGMGPEETRRVSDLLISLKGDHTIVLIEHDMDAIFAVADTLTVLAQGQLLAHGSPDEVRRNEDVINAYLGGHAPESPAETRA